MSKFKVGDKVISHTETGYFSDLLEGVIAEYNDAYDFPYLIKTDNGTMPFTEDELELVEPPPEEQLAELEEQLAELEQKIEDAKPKAARLPTLTTVTADGVDYIKIARNTWVTYENSLSFTRSNSIVVHRDDVIDDRGFEVIREGI